MPTRVILEFGLRHSLFVPPSRRSAFAIREGLMWSSRPLTDCWLKESGVWTDIPDSNVEVVLVNEVKSLISYSMVVVASKPQLPGSSFLGDPNGNGGSKDFLQVTHIA